MATYSTKKAPARKNLSDPKAALQSDVKAGGSKQSNQENFTGTGTKTIRPATSGGAGKRYSDTDREIGTRVQFADNTKGTNSVRNPLNSYRVRVYPAVVNPDPQSRRGVNKAPGRRSPTTAPTI
jgi:hypothetical protein